MEIRHLSGSEVPEYQRLARYAFDSSRNDYEELTYPALDTPLEWLYGAFESGTMVAAATVLPYRLNLRGLVMLDMGGVAGVATRPEHRNRRAVRELMDFMAREMRRQHQTISVLYPFKFSYWEKFGYRLADENVLYQFDLESLIPRSSESRIVEEVAGITEEVKHIYRQVAIHRPFMADRGEREWNRFPSKRFIFVCRTRSGVPTGYMTLEFGPYRAPDIDLPVREPGRTIMVRELFWLDRESRQSLLAVLRNHRDQRRFAVVARPLDENMVDLLDNPRVLLRSVQPNSMVRLVDVRAVLESLPAPQSVGGGFTIRLRDSLCPWNETPLRIEVRDGGVTIHDSAPADRVDLAAEIGPFSQLVVGFRTIDDLVDTAMVEVAAEKMDLLRALFPRCINFLRDFF